jgi:hypothetical protein
MFAWIQRTFHPKGEIGVLWCSVMHDSLRWPIHGRYECGVCGRQYRVPWEDESTGAARGRRSPLPSAVRAISADEKTTEGPPGRNRRQAFV